MEKGKRSALDKLNDLIFELEIATQNFTVPVASTTAPALEPLSTAPEPSKEEKKSKAPKTAQPVEPTPPASKEININSIDLRVGVIVKVERHPSAEKLYTEEIDVGEDVPRQIASGLVPYYTLEEMQGKKLIVVCNLKPRNLVGFKSHGMVLCASKKDPSGVEKDIVEFVDPPADSKPGDRIVGEGLAVLDPLTPNQVDKQKAFEAVAPELKVDSLGVATWKGMRLVTLSGEGCTAPTLKDAPIH